MKLTPAQRATIDRVASETVTWGWRRSSWDERQSRLVFFRANAVSRRDKLVFENPRLLLLRTGLGRSIVEVARSIPAVNIRVSFRSVSIQLGRMTIDDNADVARLDRTRRRETADNSCFVQTSAWRGGLRRIGANYPRLILYVGSGLSYESGVPTLPSIHRIFGVDDGAGTDFSLGPNDSLVELLSHHTFSGFVDEMTSLHGKFITAVPSRSHHRLSEAFERGWVSAILTDNVDNILERASNVPVTRTRGDGLTSMPFPNMEGILGIAASGPHALLVIGVGADRRDIIKTLARTIPVVVINPGYPVSPNSKNLDYLYDLGLRADGTSLRGNVFVKDTAAARLGEVLSLCCPK